jgi:hypothetical protein
VDALTLKVEALCWLRYGKRLEYVCTEAGRWNADVLGLCDTYAVEVEVKVSKQDLAREFTGKAAKHAVYAKAHEGVPTASVPNYFYVYVPEALEAEAVRLVRERAPYAGVAVYQPGGWLDGKLTRVAQRATKIHDQPPSQRLRQAVLLRMGSELCGRYVAWRTFCDEVRNKLVDIDIRVVGVVKQAMGVPDFDGEGQAPCSSDK